MSKAKRKPALGRGINEIFAGGASQDASLPREVEPAALRPGPWQPRQHMDETALGELARTIAARGVLQPIIARPAGDGTGFEIIAGERRWRAAQLAGLRTVPVVVREFSDRDALLAALVENIQREDLNALEQARATRRIVDELQVSVTEAADMLGMSRPALSNLLRLLELAAPVQRLLGDGKLSAGHARVLVGLPAARQLELARAVIARGLTVRQLEQLANKGGGGRGGRGGRGGNSGGGQGGDAVDADTRRLADDVSARLGSRVEIRPRGKGGTVVVHCRSLDSLDKVVKRLRGGRAK